MTLVQLRRLESTCFTIQWIIVGCATWLVLGSIFFHERLSIPNLGVGSTASSISQSATSRSSVQTLENIWRRDLRQTLLEPPPKDKPKPKPPPPPKPVRLPRLLATFVEKEQAWGLFVDQRGSQRVRSASGRVDDFVIVGVSPGTAKLSRGGKTYEVKVPIRTQHEGRRRSGHRRRFQD